MLDLNDPTSMSLTDALRYQLKGSAVSSRSYIHRTAPTNGSSFAHGGVTRLDIPTGMRNTYLDPSQTWLEFQLTPVFTTGGGVNCANLDGSAASIIRKIEVYSSAGSNLLESIDNYSVLYHANLNVMASPAELAAEGSVSEGFKPALAVITNNSAGAAVLPIVNYLSDGVKSQAYTGQTLTSGTTYTFQIPLMCMVGTLGDKYLPLHAMAADLRVEITWNSAIATYVSTVSASGTTIGNTATGDFPLNVTTTAGFASDPGYYSISSEFSTPALVTGFTDGSDAVPVLTAISESAAPITNVYLHCGMVQVSDDAQAAIDAMTGGICEFTAPEASFRALRAAAERARARFRRWVCRLHRTSMSTCSPGKTRES